MSIFEKAARAKLRFPSTVGDLTPEQLWDLPLQSRGDRPDLDTLARDAYTQLKEIGEISFVDDRPDPRKAELELQLEIVKHVIESKKADWAVAAKAAENAERKRKLLAALSAKEEGELAGMSREEIEAEIAKIAA